MNTAVVNIKIEPDLKEKAQKLASDMGLTLTAVINRYLKDFVTSKKITFYENEQPSTYLIKAIKKSKEDIKAGKVSPSFDNAEDAIAWLNKK